MSPTTWACDFKITSPPWIGPSTVPSTITRSAAIVPQTKSAARDDDRGAMHLALNLAVDFDQTLSSDAAHYLEAFGNNCSSMFRCKHEPLLHTHKYNLFRCYPPHCKLRMNVVDGGSFRPSLCSCCGSVAVAFCFCAGWAAASGSSERRDSPWKYAPCSIARSLCSKSPST